jgi:hypothetical protein
MTLVLVLWLGQVNLSDICIQNTSILYLEEQS